MAKSRLSLDGHNSMGYGSRDLYVDYLRQHLFRMSNLMESSSR
jgi:hypothetical protein